MLITAEDKERLVRGIFGQTVTTPTVITTPTAATPVISPTTAVEPVTEVTPALYAQHAIELALKANRQLFERMGTTIPRYGNRTRISANHQLFDAVLRYALSWSKISSYPRLYFFPTPATKFKVSDSRWIGTITQSYLVNFLSRNYSFVRGSAVVSPVASPVISPAPSPVVSPAPSPVVTPAPSPVVSPVPTKPPPKADVEQIVNGLLQFHSIPIVAGALRPDIYEDIIESGARRIYGFEYVRPGTPLLLTMTRADMIARNAKMVVDYLNRVGIRRGAAGQTAEYIPADTSLRTSPIPYRDVRRWWGSTDRERAEWAVKAVMRAMRIGYRKGSTSITPEQADQILKGALAWLQAVATDPGFVRDAADRRDIQKAMSMINLNLLGNMGIAVADAPDWRDRARAAVKFWLDRTPDKSMNVGQYNDYLAQVTSTAISWWKNVRDPYIRKGGAIASPSDGEVRAYVDELLKPSITITSIETRAIPTSVPVISPTPTPVVSPVPTTTTRTISAGDIARRGLAILFQQRYRSQADRRSFGAQLYYYLPANIFDEMIDGAMQQAKELYAEAGGDPAELTDVQWRTYVNSAARLMRIVRSRVSVSPTPTSVVPTTTPAMITTTTAEYLDLDDLIREVFGNILPRFGLAQTYPRAYYIPDVRRREVAGDLYSEGRRLADSYKYRQPMGIVGGLSLSLERIDEELRSRNILPQSEYAEVTQTTPVVSGDAALREWAANAPIFEDYAQCRAAAEDAVGRVPDRWRDCLTEADMVDQAVSHALIQRGIRPYPGSLELPEAAFDSIAQAGYAITQQMVFQRTYSPVVRGEVLELTR